MFTALFGAAYSVIVCFVLVLLGDLVLAITKLASSNNATL